MSKITKFHITKFWYIKNVNKFVYQKCEILVLTTNVVIIQEILIPNQISSLTKVSAQLIQNFYLIRFFIRNALWWTYETFTVVREHTFLRYMEIRDVIICILGTNVVITREILISDQISSQNECPPDQYKTFTLDEFWSEMHNRWLMLLSQNFACQNITIQCVKDVKIPHVKNVRISYVKNVNIFAC